VYMLVILAVLYIFTGLVGCLMNSGISRDACKLTRIPRIIKKKKKGRKQNKKRKTLVPWLLSLCLRAQYTRGFRKIFLN
jgi:hypothetical protein